MNKFVHYLCWTFGIGSLGLAVASLFAAMFSDSPSFLEKLSPLQRMAFNIQGLVLIGVLLTLIVSFVLQFFFKNFRWDYLVGGVSLLSFAYFYIFFSAYRS